MLHQVGVLFDLYYDARKHKIKTSDCCNLLVFSLSPHFPVFNFSFCQPFFKQLPFLAFFQLTSIYVFGHCKGRLKQAFSKAENVKAKVFSRVTRVLLNSFLVTYACLYMYIYVQVDVLIALVLCQHAAKHRTHTSSLSLSTT